MLDFIPDNLQSILIIVVLAVLFLAVMANNKRNQSKLRDRRKRNFKTDYFNLKKEREDESKS
ncbi:MULTISPECIES: hypothetical protein [Leeuwenhoekiella]|uniref:Uncharacterized protein n=1 Tax=Leeuwenhoekiella palythoae TaxID=573501 RepID=A0A1M5UH11_9FLAO|nr:MULTISPECIES: hypothetical protein [Leeuwenhoekiella]MAS19283.1 hypothetical protein [Leeuwenhoekiella sp.]MEC7784043.1 hypothetical protein [Bacteroidota bacterium]MBH13185.1 hypothetical protein [Leeuwenhoekiella sp.]MBH14001.1 hypothetical protein [Leeuwenhoekiella sp.]MEC8683418.1 hypothetical protein [Bacteroidota bacterium]|tara:strand:+ start:603 stop:788 length:186 start_codon:yes stop_codon:yes gene_type:complete